MMRINQRSSIKPGSLAPFAVFIAALFLLCVWNTQTVLAGETRPCEEDIAQFCKDVRPGGGRIILCLKNHENELTSVCKDKIQEILVRVENAKRLCASDIEKFCRGVQEGEGRIAKCLGEHATEISAACQEQVEWVKTKATGK
jgi:Golgi apparatus protein 1